ncbi:hypothetical protein L6Q21_05065 [Sandaracinobacter sp. RS1-74]|uniref:hypothetical protein n=1 Tax=Sandaracinobacteroides sayramensis TaxID=2913411 RepID=UPI001EDAB6C2|nr:hypothetical protein [Sandaracinobacteroides sayramensis]MCG2840348.1 hypothetical protein [Sandaracinobacteroides sayramensis]
MAFHAIVPPDLPAHRRPVHGRAPFRLIAALLAAGVASAPLLAQEQAPAAAPPSGGAPKVLLPDDFDTPPPVAPGMAEPAPTPLGEGVGLGGGFAPTAGPPVPVEPIAPPEPEKKDPLAELAGPTMLPDRAGLLIPLSGGYPAHIFAGADARFLSKLLGRLDGPLASRWAQIMLQRALLSVADAPAPLNPADWLASRALALQAMGSGADAHRLVSRIAIDRYTGNLYAAALQSALEATDPMALCPLSPTARGLTQSPTWVLADAMCLSILGDDIGAAALFDGLRRGDEIAAFDVGLAERVASATGGGRRGANPEWSEVKGLNAWRLGLSSAAGLEIPADMLATATPAQRAWLVRLPGQPIANRAANAPIAAAIGAISSAEINRIFNAMVATLDPGEASDSAGGRLRAANVAADVSDRVAALKALWGRAKPGTLEHYGWQVATAPAAARLPVSSGLAPEAPAIAASLVSAGIAERAGQWWRAAEGADEAVRAALWAQLVAVAGGVPVEAGLYRSWAGTVPAHRAQLLAAGLKGLGRGDVGENVAPVENDWTRALDRAVAARRTGEVMVLTATALRGSWAEVPPDYLRRIAAALVAVGHSSEARLIVAEAANRG